MMKKINPKTQPGLAALKKESPKTVKKMGYKKKGGMIKSKGMKMGGKVKPKGMKMGGKVKPKGMKMGGKVKSKGYRMGGKVKPKGMKSGGVIQGTPASQVKGTKFKGVF